MMASSGLIYLLFVFCTGSMVGPDSLCSHQNASEATRWQATYVIPTEDLQVGCVYTYQPKLNRQGFDLVSHRLIAKNYGGNDLVFLGDSGKALYWPESVSRDRVKFKLNASCVIPKEARQVAASYGLSRKFKN